ncbi:MAG: PHP domain-containing protein [Thermomicrobiales bacterium]
MSATDLPGTKSVVDLHTHTICSDGTLTPTQLIELASATGLQMVGITDHDSVAGIAEASTAADAHGISLVPGVELSSSVEGQELHLLGYFVDVTNAGFFAQLNELAGRRETRAYQMVQRLNDRGITVGFDQVKALAGSGSIGRPHVARALIDEGIVSSVSEAFDRFLSKGKSGYVPRARFEPEDAIQLVLKAGGVPVLAHPLTTGDPERVARRLQPLGLRGFEVYYSEYNAQTQRELRDIAHELGLIPTGGSDFHGPNFRPGRDLGRPVVPIETVSLLRQAAASAPDVE